MSHKILSQGAPVHGGNSQVSYFHCFLLYCSVCEFNVVSQLLRLFGMGIVELYCEQE